VSDDADDDDDDDDDNDGDSGDERIPEQPRHLGEVGGGVGRGAMTGAHTHTHTVPPHATRHAAWLAVRSGGFGGEGEDSLHFFYGSTDAAHNPQLRALLLGQLAAALEARLDGAPHEKASGCVLHSGGWKGDADQVQCAHARARGARARAFSVSRPVPHLCLSSPLIRPDDLLAGRTGGRHCARRRSCWKPWRRSRWTWWWC
jgi:hypothetical protein